MTNHEIVKKLIGEIRPVGDSHIDKERLDNLKNMCVLVNNLVLDIVDMAHMNRGAYQHSVKLSVNQADYFILELKEIIGLDKTAKAL